MDNRLIIEENIKELEEFKQENQGTLIIAQVDQYINEFKEALSQEILNVPVRQRPVIDFNSFEN